MNTNSLKTLLVAVSAVFLGLILGLLFAFFAGEDPLQIATLILKNSFGSTYDLGYTLFYAGILLLTGLAVALPLKAGLFNIGAEGQLSIGCLAAMIFGSQVTDLPPIIGIMATMSVAALAGALWGGIAGALKAWRGSHEVITTIMLNYIASGLISWIVLSYFLSRETQRPESIDISSNYFLEQIPAFEGAPFSFGLLIAPIMALVIWIMLHYTSFGFKVAGIGSNERALKSNGVATDKYRFYVMLLAGGLAGLVALPEILGAAHRYRLGFSADYGFTGIAVAFVARGHPLGAIPSALLFAILHKGTAGLDLDTDYLTRDFALILQGIVVFTVACSYLISWHGVRGRND